jgi:hypothetical protein
MKKGLSSSETSVLTRATWRNIPEDVILLYLMTVSGELSRNRLDLVGVQEVRWEGSGTVPAGEYIFSHEERNDNHELSTGLLVDRGIMSAFKRVSSSQSLCLLTQRSRVRFPALPDFSE